MLLGVAVWMLSRIAAWPVTLALWATLAFVTGYCLMTTGGREPRGGLTLVRRGRRTRDGVRNPAADRRPRRPQRSVATARRAWRSGASGPAGAAEVAPFKRIKTVVDLERELAGHGSGQAGAMLVSMPTGACRARRWSTTRSTDPGVRAELNRAVLLQADVTANDAEDQALLQHFQFSVRRASCSSTPPDASARAPRRRFQPAPEFRAHLARAFGGASP
jgi:thiol:disulfide interchange protein DsbD